jgi:hypothetical protein
MVQLFFCQLDGHVSCTYLLHLNTTSVIPLRAAPFFLGISARVLRTNPRNHPPCGFEAQPTKPSTSGFETQTTKPSSDGFEAGTTKPLRWF